MQYKMLCFILLLFMTAFAFANAILRDPFLPITNTPPLSHIEPVIQTKSEWIPLYFADATVVMDFFSKQSASLLSPAGKINVDKRSNQVWVKDDAVHLVQIKQVIKHLDQSGSQFLIRAKIINVDRQYQKALGILFQTNNQTANPLAPLSLSEPTQAGTTGQFTLAIAKLAGEHLLEAQISALEQQGHATLISSPALMTLNNQPAIIESGAEIPYQEATSSGATSVSFKKAVLRLQVTPVQMPNHHILLHISLNQDKVSALTVNGVPAIQTQQISTQVIVRNQQTIVLGGILETSHSKQRTGLPILDRIPLLGVLFEHHVKQSKQQELLIFITPSMIKALY